MLDTCVLWPSTQRDFLLSLAIERTFRPVWSAAVLAELEFHEKRKLQRAGCANDVAERRARALVDRMSAVFDDATITGWEGLEGTFGLPDADDEHVVAAAHIGRADVIVTLNLRDFPPVALPFPLLALSPAEFARQRVSEDPAAARRAVAQIARRSGRRAQQLTAEDVLGILEDRYDMSDAVSLIRI